MGLPCKVVCKAGSWCCAAPAATSWNPLRCAALRRPCSNSCASHPLACRLPWDYRHGTGQPVTADTFAGGAAAPSPNADEPAAAAAAAAGAPAPAEALTDAEAASGPCLIKGNINRAGQKIYHVPGSPSYDQTQINEAAGERWFCSEREAVAAGWRPPG